MSFNTPSSVSFSFLADFSSFLCNVFITFTNENTTRATNKKFRRFCSNLPYIIATSGVILPAISVLAGCKTKRKSAKFTFPISRPIGGIITSFTSELTMPVKAEPMIMPTDKSITLPLEMKVLNSLASDFFPFMVGYSTITQARESGSINFGTMNPENVPLIFMLGCCSVIVIPFSVLIFVLVMRGKKQAWLGTIISKEYREKEDFDDSNKKESIYTVKIKIDNGKEFNMAVDSGRYHAWKEGDRLKKESGKLWPEKVGEATK